MKHHLKENEDTQKIYKNKIKDLKETDHLKIKSDLLEEEANLLKDNKII